MLITISNQHDLAIHPLAKMIPWMIWNDVLFRKKSTEAELNRMRGDLFDAAIPLGPKEKPKRALVCLLLGHKDARLSELLAAIRSMGISSSNTVFMACATTGDVALLDAWLSQIDVALRDVVMEKNCVDIYCLAAKNGHLAFLQYIEGFMTKEQKQRVIEAHHYAVYEHAAINGHIDILKHLQILMTIQQKGALIGYFYTLHLDVARNGQTKTLHYLTHQMTKEEKQKILPSGWREKLYIAAAENGHIGTLKYLKEQMVKNEKQKVLTAEGYNSAYVGAAENGRIDTLDYLKCQIPPEQQIASRNKAYRRAARYDDIKILQYLEKDMTPEQCRTELLSVISDPYYNAESITDIQFLSYLEKILTFEQYQQVLVTCSYRAYCSAASNGQITMLRYLEGFMTPEQKQELFEAYDYFVYRLAAEHGHIEVLRHLEQQMSEKQKEEALEARGYDAYCLAAKHGHIEVLRHLEQQMLEKQKEEALEADNYHAYCFAARNGHIEVLRHLEQQMSEKQKEEALEADNYHAYCFAASNGHIEVLLHLEQRMSEKQQQEALEARDYYAYSSAASDRHIDVLLHLEDRMTKKQKQAAIISLCANDRHVFQASRCRLIFNHLIHFPEFFAWALMVQQEIIESAREKIQSRLWYFAEKQLQKWQKQSALFADNDPNGLFNLAEDEASIALCIAMWLIRIEDAKVTEKLRFLMCIPNVVSCAKEIIKTISGIDAIEECPEKWAREQWRWIDHARNRPEPGGYFYRTDYEHLKRDTWTCIQCLWLLTDFSQLVPWMGQHKKRITTYDADETRLTTRPRTRRYVSEQENADITDELLLNAHLFFSAAASTSPVISEDANDLPLENKACLT